MALTFKFSLWHLFYATFFVAVLLTCGKVYVWGYREIMQNGQTPMELMSHAKK